MIVTVISAIVGGLLIGALARLVIPGKQRIGVIMTIVLGVAGSAVGSWLVYLLGYRNSNGGWEIIPFVAGVVIAALLIAGFVAVTDRKSGTTK